MPVNQATPALVLKRGHLLCHQHYGTEVRHVCVLSHSMMCAQEMDPSSSSATSP